ncbi:serine hydrolase [Fulvivirga sp. 29W222]|uniref:beta-N-acetylhexosaminidase n=1 Tax=Fulvivirga marina TaxID=2494733 RepID=A0A937FT38_9BACT|nr:glycoside hydrolase family 3 N-terminal domain-containing protein [Fulvivirga marina]MBL6444864.1 serine hydrolase [Fulvivirga marina]
MIKKVFSATLFIFSTLTYSFSQNQEQERWVDSVFNALNLEQQIGQLFMIPVYSGGNEKHFQVVERLVEKNHIGGLIFMQGSPTRQINLTNRFQTSSTVPLLIAMDMEWGTGMQLDSTIHFPKQLALGAIENDSLIYAMGAEIAREMKILGVHMNFAPVADINTNPENPVIGVRSFGSNKQHVSNKAIAYMRGLQENGVLSCAKHFPGHGDTRQDSHLALPRIDHNKKRLDTLELYPFKKLIYAGSSAIMATHIHVTAIDGKKNIPASLSPKVINDILREELKYDGLVITDALNIRAITDHYKNGEAELLALQAGNDILIYSENVPEAIALIKKNLSKKKLSKSQFEASVKRVLRAKFKAGLNKWDRLNTENIKLKLNKPDIELLKHELIEKSITVVNNTDSLLPVRTLDNKTFASLSIGPSGEFPKYLDKYTFFSHYKKGGKEKDNDILYKQLRNYDVVVVGLFDLDKSQGINGVTQEMLHLFDKLNDETELIFCLFDSPYSLKALDNYDHLICTFDNNEQLQKLIPSAIFGGISTSGRMPVNISKAIKFGQGVDTQPLNRLSFSTPESVSMDSQVLQKIDDIAHEAIQDRATPGCQVLVARNGKIVFEKSYGYYTYDSLKAVDDYTIYDIASITKVLSTMQALMFLEERGLIDLDKKISVYLPELRGTNKEHMIIRDILTHQAGLWPYLPFWKRTLEASFLTNGLYKAYPENGFEYQVSEGLFTTEAMQDSVWRWVKQSKLRDKVAKKPFDYKYSDMGYYLLKKMIEEIINQPIDEFLQQNYYDPMGLTSLGYLPLCHFPLSRIAPTEKDEYFRNTLVYGMVHDQGAALCGGIAGHAGLFSSALDLAKMMQMHLQDGTYGNVKFFQPGTIGRFTQQQYETNRRGIGWDKPAVGEWNGPTSEFASPKTFGHTGFTGTAVWADPEFNLIYVFLSNRIHPNANNSKLIKNNIRTRIQDVIYESIWSYEQRFDSY